MNLLNRFIVIGNLTEINIELFHTHIKIKLSVEINDKPITCYGTISYKFNQSMYNKIINIIPYLFPKIEGYVYFKNDKHYKLKPSNHQTKLFISGNLSQYSHMLFFNLEHIDLINQSYRDRIEIELEGQFVDKDKLLNITSDSPRIFNIAAPKNYKTNVIYKTKIRYNHCYDIINEEIVFNKKPLLDIYSFSEKTSGIPKEGIESYLLEWKILNEI